MRQKEKSCKPDTEMREGASLCSQHKLSKRQTNLSTAEKKARLRPGMPGLQRAQVETRGVEPLTFWLPARRSSQLS